MKQLLIIIPLLLLLAACSADDGPVQSIPPEKTKGVLILNEGLFGQDNATLTLYDTGEQQVYHDVYATANSGDRLGDTANDMVAADGKLYIAVDNSNKIEVLDVESYESLGSIPLGDNGSPREILYLSATEAYVTSLYRDIVYRFNPTTITVTAEIPVGSRPEGIAAHGDYLFVANSGLGYGTSVSVLSRMEGVETAIIDVGVNPRMVLSDEEYVYVVCTGIYNDEGRGGVYRIDPVSLSVRDSLAVLKNPGEAALDGRGGMLLANADALLKIDLASFTIENKSFIRAPAVNPMNGVIYSVFYDEASSLVYCGNPRDNVQAGEVAVFTAEGVEQQRIPAGLNPGTILFIH